MRGKVKDTTPSFGAPRDASNSEEGPKALPPSMPFPPTLDFFSHPKDHPLVARSGILQCFPSQTSGCCVYYEMSSGIFTKAANTFYVCLDLATIRTLN